MKKVHAKKLKKNYINLCALFLVLLIVVGISGCSTSLSCSNCKSSEFTGSKGDNLKCSNCGANIYCPDCKGTLVLAGTLESDGTWHDEGVCSNCDKRYRLN